MSTTVPHGESVGTSRVGRRKRGRYMKITPDMKKMIIKEHERGGDPIDLAERLGIKKRTAYNILQKTSTETRKRGGRRENCVKVTDEIKSTLLIYLEEHNDATLKELKDAVNGVVSISTIGNVLDGEAITTKQLRPVPVGKNTPENIERRRIFSDFYQNDHGHRIHVDECNFNLFTRRNVGRAPKGQRTYRPLHNARGRNVNILLAIDDSKVVLWRAVLGSCKNDIEQFFADLSAELGEETCTIYMDNAPVHRKASNFERVKSNHTIKLFTAAYSPELNPVEGCFSVIKSFIKQQLRMHDPSQDHQRASELNTTLCNYREQKLVSMVEPSIRLLTREHLRNFYRHVDKWITKAANKEPFSENPWFDSNL